MCSIGAVGGTNQHLKLFLHVTWITRRMTPRVTSLVLASSIVGRLLMGWLADRIPEKVRDDPDLPACSRGVPLLFLVDKPGASMCSPSFLASALGGDYMIIPLMAAELFGLRVMGG